MFTQFFNKWRLFALRGLLAVIFGILALIWPGLTLQALILLFGAYALVDGIFAVTAGIVSIGSFKRWWAVLLEGVVGILVGLLTFFWPNITGLALLYFIAAWAVVTGVFEIVAAIQLRRVITGEWRMVLSGILSIFFGALLFVFPGAGALSLVWLIGVYAIIFGIALIVLAFRLRGLRSDFETAKAN
jgi:uncharacterized membrane protein HdeD (DUF308 family)